MNRTFEEVFAGEWKTTTEYLIKCPYCGDHPTHNHCYVNFERGQFHCKLCDRGGSIVQLEKDFCPDEFVEEPKTPMIRGEVEKIDFEKFEAITGMSGLLDRMARKYLMEKRGMTESEIKFYDVRFSSYGSQYGRVLFPIYEKGIVVCFAGRGFIAALRTKWRFPKKGETLLTASECLFGMDIVESLMPKEIILVEGIFDAIVLNRFCKCTPELNFVALALMGKKLHDTQLYKLLTLPESTQFYVMLDADASKAELEVAKKLKMYDRTVRLCDLNDYPRDIKLVQEAVILEPEHINFEWELANIMANAKVLDINLELKSILDE